MSEAYNETYSLRFASTSPTDPFENQLLSYRSVPHSEQREEGNLKKVPRICRVKAMDCAATFITMHQRTFIYPRWCLTNSTSPEWVDFGFDILDIDVKATCGSRSTTSKCRRFICLQRSICLSRIYYFPHLTRYLSDGSPIEVLMAWPIFLLCALEGRVGVSKDILVVAVRIRIS